MNEPCINCGNPIVPIERFMAGYTYCKDHECVTVCHEKPNNIIVSNLHKQGPMVFSAAEIFGKNAYDRG